MNDINNHSNNGNGSAVRLDDYGALWSSSALDDYDAYARASLRSTRPLPAPPPFSKQEIESCLRYPELERVAFEIAEDATEKMWKLSLSDDYGEKQSDEIKAAYRSYHSRLETLSVFQEALSISRSHGGSCIILKINDGRHHSEPVNMKAIKTIRAMSVRHRFQIRPVLSDPRVSKKVSFQSKLYLKSLKEVEFYELINVDEDLIRELSPNENGNSPNGLAKNIIHKSRILRFDGTRMPDDWQIERNQGWSYSVFDKTWENFHGFANGLKGCDELIKTHSALHQSIEGFRKIISENSKLDLDLIRKAARSIRTTYDLYGLLLTDTKEDVRWDSRPTGGMSELVETRRDAFIGASGMPHTILFGESPGGLGRDGKETQFNWSRKVSTYQTRILEPQAKRLDDLIFHAKDGPTRGKPIEEHSRIYESTLRKTPEDIIQERSTSVQTLGSAIQYGFALEDEARTVISDPDWWPELTLDPKAWDKKKKEAKQQQDPYAGMDLNQFYQQQEQAPPEEDQVPEQEVQTDSLRLDASEFRDKKLHAQVRAEAKRKFKVWPSAYASAWMVKEYKRRGGKLSTREDSTRFDDLKRWFNEEWVRMGANGEILGACGDRSDREGKPKCLPRKKAESLSPEERIALVRRKRSQDPNPDRSGKAKMVSSQINRDAIIETIMVADPMIENRLYRLSNQDLLDELQNLVDVLSDRVLIQEYKINLNLGDESLWDGDLERYKSNYFRKYGCYDGIFG